MSDDTDQWLEVDANVDQALPEAAAHVLSSVASTLEEAPEGRRYDLKLSVEERSVDAETDREGQ